MIKRHLLPNLATTLGHQRHDKHSLQSTNLPFTDTIQEIKKRIEKLNNKVPINQDFKTTLTQDIDQDAFPQSESFNKKM